MDNCSPANWCLLHKEEVAVEIWRLVFDNLLRAPLLSLFKTSSRRAKDFEGLNQHLRESLCEVEKGRCIRDGMRYHPLRVKTIQGTAPMVFHCIHFWDMLSPTHIGGAKEKLPQLGILFFPLLPFQGGTNALENAEQFGFLE